MPQVMEAHVRKLGSLEQLRKRPTSHIVGVQWVAYRIAEDQMEGIPKSNPKGAGSSPAPATRRISPDPNWVGVLSYLADSRIAKFSVQLREVSLLTQSHAERKLRTYQKRDA